MKKLLSVVLLFCMIIMLAACGKNTESVIDQADNSSVDSTDQTNNSPVDSTDQTDNNPADSTDQTDNSPVVSTDQTGNSPLNFTDMTGREISLDGPATKIVSLAAADCEILYAIGAEDLIIGRGEYCDYPAEIEDIEMVQSGYETNIEQIIALQPQVLLMSKMAQTVEQIAQIEAAGITVVESDAQDIDGVYATIEMLGIMTGKNSEAAALIESMKETFKEIAEDPVSDGSKTVYFEVSPLEYGLWAAGSSTFMNEIAEMMGLSNCFSDLEGWASVSEEQVIERDPDYIVTISMYYGEGATPEEEIMARSGWENITAVKNSAVFNLRDNEFSRPGPRLAEGAKMLYDFIKRIPSE